MSILALLLAAPSFGAIYKWVDEKGVTHFSETPPPDGKAATKIEPRPQPPMSDAPARLPSWKDREMEFRARRVEKEQAEDARRTGAEQDAARKRERCLKAQRELHVLQSEIPVYQINARGEREYLEDKDRPAEIAAWKRVAEANCEK